MRPSPLSLREYYTTALNFSARPGFDINDPTAGRIFPDDLDVDVNVWVDENSLLDRGCQILVKLKDPSGSKFPWSFSISLVGFFEITPDWPIEQVDGLFNANAPALLYSAAREAIATITGRGPYSEAVLPSVTFIQFPSDKSPNEKQLVSASLPETKANGGKANKPLRNASRAKKSKH